MELEREMAALKAEVRRLGDIEAVKKLTAEYMQAMHDARWDDAVAWARLDGPFAVGTTGVLKPKGGPKVTFVIETLEAGSEFTDVSSMPGAKLRIRHLVATDEERTRIDIEVSITGPLAGVWRRLIGKGIITSTPDGLAKLVEVAESDAAVGR